MRKVNLTILLAALSSNVAATWFEVGRNELATYYVDPVSMRRTDNMVRILTLVDLKTVDTFNGKPYLSVKFNDQFDCTEGQPRVRRLSISTFPNNMGEGQEEALKNSHGNWDPVTFGSIGDDFSKFACAVVGSSKSAEWVAVVKVASDSGNDDGTDYANPSNMSKSGNKVKMWSLLDLKTALEFNQANVHIRTLSIKKRREYDCKEKKTRDLSSSLFSENMGKGIVNYSESVEGKTWETFSHNSVIEGLWEFACGKRKSLSSQQP